MNVVLLLAGAGDAAALKAKVAALPPRRQRRGERGTSVPSFFFGNTRTIEQPDEDDDYDED
jgi:hypothetical protein